MKKLYNELKELLHIKTTDVDIPCTLETKLIIPNKNTDKFLFVNNGKSQWSLPFAQVNSQNSVYETAYSHVNQFAKYSKNLELVGLSHQKPKEESMQNKISFCFKTDPIANHQGLGEWQRCDHGNIDAESMHFLTLK